MFRIHAHLNYSNVKSPSLIQPIFRKSSQKITLRTAGRTKQIRIMPSQSNPVMAVLVPAAISLSHPVYTPICPTKPQVPIPEETAGPFICNLKIQVAIGQVMAEAKVGGIQIFGFFTMLPI